MNFFGVGPLELILILAVGIIFVGHERLPRLAADLARTISDIRRYTGGLASEFNEVVKDFERETESERSEWKQIGEGIGSATRSVTDALHEARTSAAPPAPPIATLPTAPADPGAWREIGTGLDSTEAMDTPPHVNGNGASPAPDRASNEPS